MATILEQLINKVGLHGEPKILEKTTELIRLLELRSANVPPQINEYGKIMLCIDLASFVLGIAIDNVQALKLSGLRRTQYANNKRIFEKLLDINKIVDVNDICIQLNLNEVSKKATELLQLYKKTMMASEDDTMDFDHPQYAAMAVFCACKLLKHKPPKAKLMPFSNLRPTQWQQLERRWEKFVTNHCKSIMDTKAKLPLAAEIDSRQTLAEQAPVGNITAMEKNITNKVEDYEVWKARMLRKAEQQLKEVQEKN